MPISKRKTIRVKYRKRNGGLRNCRSKCNEEEEIYNKMPISKRKTIRVEYRKRKGAIRNRRSKCKEEGKRSTTRCLLVKEKQ